ncbi:N-acetylmuramoyl-L-alanine amidase [Corynebacterium freneyi]|nr:N-acetylmuramoyl-L-alanine amidase [Corynebacterium freneyi]MCG7438853.1 N-acetylmuramoyl-L-alanine amidase [Corynebacterium freneyi]
MNRRRISAHSGARKPLIFSVVSALIAAPLVALGGTAAIELIEDNGRGPVDVLIDKVALSTGSSVLVEDAAIATQSVADELHPNRGVVKELRRDEEFSMFALTWTGSADVASYFRALRPDGTWSEWYSAEPHYPAEGEGNGLNGTELVFVEPTTAVQISTHGLNVFGPGSGVTVDDIEGSSDLTDEERSRLEDYLGAGSSGGGDADTGDVTGSSEDRAAADDAATGSTDGAGIPGGTGSLGAPGEEGQPHEIGEGSSDPRARDVKESAGANGITINDLPAWRDIEAVNDEVPLDDVEAVFIDGNVQEGDGIDPIVDAKNLTGMPRVITRAGWGANENSRCRNATYDDSMKATTVHHTAGSNNYTEAQAAGIVRGVYHYHAQTLGWCDVGYNAMVDKYGNIYEGRYGGLDKNVQGAHAGGFNKNTWGISMLGDYSSVQPTQAMINSVGNMLGWRHKVAGVDPKGTTTLTSAGSHYAKYPYGTQVKLPNIFAHRDVGNTTCPGNAGYAQMDNIRSIADKKYKSLNRGNIVNEAPSGGTDITIAGADTGTGNTGDGTTEGNRTGTGTDDTTGGNGTGTGNTGGGTTDDGTIGGNGADTGTGTDGSGSSGGNGAGTGADTGDSGSVSEDDALTVISGARSILAAAFGVLGTPGLGETSDAIFAAVGKSVEEGPSIDDIPVLVEKILEIDEENDLAAEWASVVEQFGDVLGPAQSGVQNGATVANPQGRADTLRYVKFENGIITDSHSTGSVALWGEIADAWAKQGFEVGDLGAPTSTQTIEDGVEKAEFQGGTITFDPATGKVSVDLK